MDETSEEEDFTEADPDFEEDSNEEGPVTHISRTYCGVHSSSTDTREIEGLTLTHGPTRSVCVEDIQSTFELFFTTSILNNLLKMTNLKGRRVFISIYWRSDTCWRF